MKKSLKALLFSLVAVLLVACGNGGSNGEEGGNDAADTDTSEGTDGVEQVLNWTTSAELPTMDATIATDTVSFEILSNTNEGLYRQSLDQEGVFELGVIEGEPEVSEDGLTNTYTIREDANWENGEPVTAQDFVYSWQRLVDPETAASYSYLMDGFIVNASEIIAGEMDPSELGVTAVDDKTLEVQLVKQVPYLEGLLAMPAFMPLNEAFVEEQGDAYGTDSETVLYNGPFTLEDWDGTGLTWTLAKSDTYWDADTVQLEQVNYQVLKEQGTAISLFDSGEVDFTKISNEYVQQREADPNRQENPESSVFYIKMNQERDGEETPLANENIRHGIAQAVNKESMVTDVLQDGSQIADYFVPTNLSYHPDTEADFREDSGEHLPYDAEAANEAFQAGLEEIGEESITLDLLTDDTEGAQRSAEFLQAQLMENLEGLEITLSNVPFKNRLEQDVNQDYDLQISGWSASYNDPIYYLDIFLTDGGNNNSGYANPEYDALIQQSEEQTDDEAARWETLVEAEELLLSGDAAIAPLYQRVQNYLISPSAQDVGVHAVGSPYSFKWAYVTE